jgi:putative heme degradation protein
MPLSPPPLVLEVGSGTKFQLLLFFNIVGPFLGLTRNLGARHSRICNYKNLQLKGCVRLIRL